MLPHPFKTDTWIEGERSNHANLCSEIDQPMSGTGWCTLGMKDSMMKYLGLNNEVHQAQVHARVWELIGDPDLKLINSFYSGATPDQLMDPQDVLDLARELYDEHEEDLTELYNILGKLRAHRVLEGLERIKLFGSAAINQSFKEQGIMTSTTDQIAKLTQVQNTGMSIGTDELVKLIEEAAESTDGTKALAPKLSGLDKPRKIKRKKSKPKSNHLPNMRNARTKRVLGATILNMLGKVQQETHDSYKRSLLKEIPLADFVELASGEKLPDYQANLLNAMQAKADPAAPIVERVNAGTVPAIKEHVDAIQPMQDNGPAMEIIQKAFDGSVASDERLAAHDQFVEALYPGTLEREATPTYELDDGPLTDEQMDTIRKEAGDYDTANFTRGIFGRGLTAPVLAFDDAPEQLTNEAHQAIFEQNLDNALARYVTPSVFPEGTTDEFRADVIAQVKAAVIERNMSIDQQTLVTEAMSIVYPLETIVA